MDLEEAILSLTKEATQLPTSQVKERVAILKGELVKSLPSLRKTNRPLRIYVSGPYSADPDKWVPLANLVGHYWMAVGHMVFVPHTMTHDWPGLGYEDYMKVDLDIVKRWANAICFMAPSPGANRELILAWNEGYPILSRYSLSELLEIIHAT